MKEILDWTIVYEALSGIPLHYGVEVTNSVVVCTMQVDGTRALLGGTIRIDGGVMNEPGVIVEILRQQSERNCNGALIAVVRPERGLGIDDFFEHLYRNWPLDFHMGNVLQTDEAIAAGCGCGERKELGDELELLGTTTASLYQGRRVLRDEKEYRARRTPGGVTARKFAVMLTQVRSHLDTAEATRHVLSELRGSTPMMGRAAVLCALDHTAFRDGLIVWACGFAGAPDDFALVPYAESAPHHARIESAIDALRRLCRWAPRGGAAAPLATAAYLAWYTGNGLQARVLAQQALTEDPGYSLARIVEDALLGMVPPPWVEKQGERLVG